MIQTRGYVLKNDAGEVIHRASNPGLVRKWFRENKATLPPGDYWIDQVIRQYSFNTPTDLGDAPKGNWKPKKLVNQP